MHITADKSSHSKSLKSSNELSSYASHIISILISDLIAIFDSFIALKAGSGCADFIIYYVISAELSLAVDPQSLANHPCLDFCSGYFDIFIAAPRFIGAAELFKLDYMLSQLVAILLLCWGIAAFFFLRL